MMNKQIKILAVSGSLRPNSSNAIILQVLKKLMPAGIEFIIYNGLAELPPFDDAEQVPIAVSKWRKSLQDADAVLVCSPEYAFGVPGSLKNAFDWTVGSGEMVNKPLALITASTGGEKAHAAWLQVFTALSANIPDGCALLVSYVRSKLNAAGEISDDATLQSVQNLVKRFIHFIQQENDQL